MKSLDDGTNSRNKASKQPAIPLMPIEKIIVGLQNSKELEVRNLEAFIRQDNQRGVRAKRHFSKGDFVCEYPGEMISIEEANSGKKITPTMCVRMYNIIHSLHASIFGIGIVFYSVSWYCSYWALCNTTLQV